MRDPRMPGLKGALLEGVLIVFAVLAALAVDEFWEDREEQELAAVALERIASEIHTNRTEISASRDENLALRDRLTEALGSHAATGTFGLNSVNYEVALLGADAWETARVTRAVHFIDFDRVSRISQVYRIQQLYLDRQDQVVAEVAGIGGDEAALLNAFRSIRAGLAITLRLECDLVAAFDSLLADLDPVGRASGADALGGC